MQIDLFQHVAGAYAQPVSGQLTNDELYRIAAGRAGIDASDVERKTPIGKDGTERSVTKRAIRWHQQTLRMLGVIQKVDGQRGVWELTAGGRQKMRQIGDGMAVLGFSTNLGVAIWGNSNRVFDQWDEPICLCLTSPPYPLRSARAYGNVDESEYTDFISRILEPIIRNLVPGGNIALNISNDIFQAGLPSRSLYVEKLTIALCERFGLSLMDRLIWENPNKPPGPLQWASLERKQLNAGYEPVLWFTNDPELCIANNQRVLEPHSEQQQKLIARGGESSGRVNGDGAYRIKPGAFGNPTEGRIPRNILQVSSNCANQRQYKRDAAALGLQAHGAPMPVALARKLVKFLSDVGQLVVDPCAGSMTTPLAAELEGRRWAATDIMYDYVRGGAERFREFDGFDLALPEDTDVQTQEQSLAMEMCA